MTLRLWRRDPTDLPSASSNALASTSLCAPTAKTATCATPGVSSFRRQAGPAIRSEGHRDADPIPLPSVATARTDRDLTPVSTIRPQPPPCPRQPVRSASIKANTAIQPHRKTLPGPHPDAAAQPTPRQTAYQYPIAPPRPPRPWRGVARSAKTAQFNTFYPECCAATACHCP